METAWGNSAASWAEAGIVGFLQSPKTFVRSGCKEIKKWCKYQTSKVSKHSFYALNSLKHRTFCSAIELYNRHPFGRLGISHITITLASFSKIASCRLHSNYRIIAPWSRHVERPKHTRLVCHSCVTDNFSVRRKSTNQLVPEITKMPLMTMMICTWATGSVV